MSEKYKIIVEKEGVNHVKIFKSVDDGYTNDWNFPLKGDDEPIVLSEFYTETKFIVMNWDGWIRAYNAETKTSIAEIKLHGKIDTQAVLSIDKSILYATLRNESNQIILAIIPLDSFTINSLELPEIYKNHLAIRKDGNLIFYKHDYERVDGKKIFKHYFSVLDMIRYDVEQFEIPFAPQFSFGDFKPVIDFEKNRAIMLSYDDVTTKTTEAGETVFEFKIVLLDLTTFKVASVLSVRDFAKSQLAYYEDECDTLSELFLGPNRDENYMDAVRDFYGEILSIKIVPDGMWICWQDGSLRKINSDFSMSPLYKIDDSLAIHDVNGSVIILKFGNDFYKAQIPIHNSEDFEGSVQLELEKTSLDELYKITYSEEQKEAIETQDHIKIKVTDLSAKEGIQGALAQIQIIVSDLKTAGIGSTLLFDIKDNKGTKLEEPEFFAQAVLHSPNQVQLIIETLIKSKIKYLYRNPEQTALCHAVYELAKQGNQYLTTALKYLNAIDLDHDVFNRENLIPLLEETYSPEQLIQKMKAISENLTEWYEEYCEM